MLNPDDRCVLISKSANTQELFLFARTLQARGVGQVLLCCEQGKLADLVDMVVTLPFEREACDFNMVPTSSIMVTLAYGHGVALELAYRNGLTPQGFARVHPAGSLGKICYSLLINV